MKTVLILRHAKSSWKQPEVPDHDRPLNKRGEQDAPRIGTLIQAKGLVPDLIISSTAKRARKTAKLVAKKSGYKEKFQLTPAFYHAGPRAYIAVLNNLQNDYNRVMVVGHNPGLEQLVENLTGQIETMPTASLAHILLPINDWSEFDRGTHGELVHLWRPKELF